VWTISYYVLLVLLLLGSGVYWMQAAIVVAVEDARVGGPDASVWATLARASRRANALTAALLLLSAFAGLSMLLFFVPLILVGRLALVAPALVLEDARVVGAVQRSWQLTQGRTIRLLGLALLTSAILFAAFIGMLIGIGSADAGLAGTVVGLLLGASALVVILAWLGAAWALVYEDARRARPPGGGG
jgi:hypothetical protein